MLPYGYPCRDCRTAYNAFSSLDRLIDGREIDTGGAAFSSFQDAITGDAERKQMSRNRNRQPLPPYSAADLLRVGRPYSARYEVPEDVREDMAADLALAALEAGKKAKPGAGTQRYQHQAGEWAAKALLREWKRERKHAPASVEHALPRLERRLPVENDDDEYADRAAKCLIDTDTPLTRLVCREM